jgi:hypothetical protein
MDPAIFMLSPIDTPLLTGLGTDGLAVLPSRPVDEIVFSNLTDEILTPRSVITGGALTTGDTVVTVATGDRTKFSTGDVITFEKLGVTNDEVARVTGYGVTDHTLLISRAYAGGVATNYLSGADIIGLGTALAEGSDPEAARTVDRVESTNVTQIFGPTAVHLSRTEQQVRKYGVNNEFAHQGMGRTRENAISREQAFLYGRKFNSTTAKIRMTGGLSHFLTTNVDNTNTQLTATTIQSSETGVYNEGGAVDLLIAHPAALADLNDLTNTSVVVVEARDAMRGRRRVMTVETEYGTITVVRNRWCEPNDAFGINREQVIRRILQPLILERLAKTGDSDKAQIVCEEGLQINGQEQMFRMTNIGGT